MILVFKLGEKMVKVKVKDRHVFFSEIRTGFKTFYPIELAQTKQGILKEHPDLKGLSFKEMREVSAQRLQKHLDKLGDDEKIRKYVIKELEKEGWTLI